MISLIRRPDFTVVLGDFNAKSTTWCDKDTTTFEGTRIEALTALYGLHQIISEPTHILPNSTSCIDLIFSDQPNLIVDSGVHPSLHPNCHHQITFCKLNLKIFYPPPYKRLVWNYKKANIDCIERAIRAVHWEHLFLNKSVHEQVMILNDTLLNIFSNFVPNKLITIDDKDPPWMTEEIKVKIQWKNKIYQEFMKSNKNHDNFLKLENAIFEVS